MKNIIKGSPILMRCISWLELFMKAYFPTLRAKIAYRIAYGKKCDLKQPKTLSEKLLWLSLNTYRNNKTVMELSDKYLVRNYVEKQAGKKYLNELFFVYNSIKDIDYQKLPQQFALKVSQGCATNVFCDDKTKLDKREFDKTLKNWGSGQRLYDKVMADVGGIPRKQLPKYYICEKLLQEKGKKSPTDYKIYCFNGVPKAILVISDRFEQKSGLFMSTNWEVLGELSGSYKKPSQIYSRPKSLDDMLLAAEKLSAPFPFVRIDMYDINGNAVFGEMTFFPNGCVHFQETQIDGKSMGETLVLPIS